MVVGLALIALPAGALAARRRRGSERLDHPAADHPTGGRLHDRRRRRRRILQLRPDRQGDPAAAPASRSPPADAPRSVRRAIRFANQIVDKPYRLGGGHRLPWRLDSAYDCSGTVSWALHGARLLRSPLPSGSFRRWGDPGLGRWISVYYNGGHAYMTIAGLRLDTSMVPGSGPGWSTKMRSSAGYAVRHAPASSARNTSGSWVGWPPVQGGQPLLSTLCITSSAASYSVLASCNPSPLRMEETTASITAESGHPATHGPRGGDGPPPTFASPG